VTFFKAVGMTMFMNVITRDGMKLAYSSINF